MGCGPVRLQLSRLGPFHRRDVVVPGGWQRHRPDGTTDGQAGNEVGRRRHVIVDVLTSRGSSYRTRSFATCRDSLLRLARFHIRASVLPRPMHPAQILETRHRKPTGLTDLSEGPALSRRRDDAAGTVALAGKRNRTCDVAQVPFTENM